jgi:hypothetical protein
MEAELAKVLASLNEKPQSFRDQVERLREFRKRMTEAGATTQEEPFAISLIDRLEMPHSTSLANIIVEPFPLR